MDPKPKTVGTFKSNGKTLTVKIDLRKVREGYYTHDAGVALMNLGSEFRDGCRYVLTPFEEGEVYI